MLAAIKWPAIGRHSGSSAESRFSPHAFILFFPTSTVNRTRHGSNYGLSWFSLRSQHSLLRFDSNSGNLASSSRRSSKSTTQINIPIYSSSLPEIHAMLSRKVLWCISIHGSSFIRIPSYISITLHILLRHHVSWKHDAIYLHWDLSSNANHSDYTRCQASTHSWRDSENSW